MRTLSLTDVNMAMAKDHIAVLCVAHPRPLTDPMAKQMHLAAWVGMGLLGPHALCPAPHTVLRRRLKHALSIVWAILMLIGLIAVSTEWAIAWPYPPEVVSDGCSSMLTLDAWLD